MAKDNKISILIIDDEVELSEILCERLAFRGFEADCVCNHIDAIKLAESKHYDVAIIDVKLKGINGIELMKLLFQIIPTLKVILITGHGTEEEGMRGLSLGASRYLVKPINIDTLTSEIMNVLGESSNEEGM